MRIVIKNRKTKKSFNNNKYVSSRMGVISLLDLLEMMITEKIHMSFFIELNSCGIIS